MATPMTLVGSTASGWVFGTNGLTDVTAFEASREYSVQLNHIHADGSLDDVILAGEIHKGSITKYGDGTMGSSVLGASHAVPGVLGTFITKLGMSSTNEDFSRQTLEVMGGPALA